MPYMIVEEDGKYCVHKQNEDESAGEKLKCYDAKPEAEDYLKALEANTTSEQARTRRWYTALATSLDKQVSAVREAFYKAFANKPLETTTPIVSQYVVEVFDEYVIVDQSGQLYQVNYATNAEGGIEFDAAEKWIKVKVEYVALSSGGRELKYVPDVVEVFSSDFLFVQLESGGAAKLIDGMAAGTFTNMRGNKVTFSATELPDYVANTMATIESTRADGGELVGLPIDENNHDHNGGAGWIVGLELDTARNIIKFLVNWTEKGRDLISKNLRRFFSPTIDMSNKVILGGSLTNWPATRNKKGHLILKPVELSQTLKFLQGENMPNPVSTDTQALAQPPVNPEIADLLQTPEATAELGKRATEMAAVMLAADKRKQHVVEFAAALVGGTRERPIGLKVPAAEVVSVLLSLPVPQADAVERLLLKALTESINFSERGFKVDENGFIHKPAVPMTFKPYLQKWVKAGKSVAEFFAVNPELGEMSEYNLAEFTPKEK